MAKTIYIDLAGRLDKYEESLKRAERRTTNASARLKKAFSGIAAAAAAAFSVQQIAAFVKDSVKLAGELKGVQQAFERLNRPDLLANLRASTRNTVSDLQLMKTAVQANNFKIPLEELGTLLEFAQKRATQTGESVDYMVNSIVTGIARKSLPILDNLGISATELRDEVKKVGDFGKAAGNIVARELGKMGDVVLTVNDRVAILNAGFENWKAQVGTELIPVANELMAAFTDLADSLSASGASIDIIGFSIKTLASGLISILAVGQGVANILGTIGAAAAALFTGQFDLIPSIASVGFEKTVEDAENMFNRIAAMWKDHQEKLGGGSGNENGVSPIAKQVKVEIEEIQALGVTAITTTGAVMSETQAQLLDMTKFTRDEMEVTSQQLIEEMLEMRAEARLAYDTLASGFSSAFSFMRLRASENANAMEIIFENMANSFIQQVGRMITQWAIFNLLSFATGGGGINFFSMLGFGGSATDSVVNTATSGGAVATAAKAAAPNAAVSAGISQVDNSIKGLNRTIMRTPQPTIIIESKLDSLTFTEKETNVNQKRLAQEVSFDT